MCCLYRFCCAAAVSAAIDRDSCSTPKCSTNTPRCSSHCFTVFADAAAAMAALACLCVMKMQREKTEANTRRGCVHELPRTQDSLAPGQHRGSGSCSLTPGQQAHSVLPASSVDQRPSTGRVRRKCRLPHAHAPQKRCLGPRWWRKGCPSSNDTGRARCLELPKVQQGASS